MLVNNMADWSSLFHRTEKQLTQVGCKTNFSSPRFLILLTVGKKHLCKCLCKAVPLELHHPLSEYLPSLFHPQLVSYY